MFSSSIEKDNDYERKYSYESGIAGIMLINKTMSVKADLVLSASLKLIKKFKKFKKNLILSETMICGKLLKFLIPSWVRSDSLNGFNEKLKVW